MNEGTSVVDGGGVNNFVMENEGSVSEKSAVANVQLKKRDRPYLILDIRDVDDYKRGRLVTSKSYPFPRLMRSVNYETKDMLKFKNVQGEYFFLIQVKKIIFRPLRLN